MRVADSLGRWFNVRRARTSLAHASGQAAALARLGGSVPGPEERCAEGHLAPFTGEWMVARGGITPETSHSWNVVNQRYAYDFVMVDDAGRPHDNSGRNLSDYYAFGQPVVASKGGVVVEAKDGRRDFPRVGGGRVDTRAPDPRGNYVIIEHEAGEYSLLCHLMRGSVSVLQGSKVSVGEQIGACGNSGNTTQPHIHFHVQDMPDSHEAASIPIRFEGRFLTRFDRLSGTQPMQAPSNQQTT